MTNGGIGPGGDVTAIIYQEVTEDGELPKALTSLEDHLDESYYRGEVPAFSPAMFDHARRLRVMAGANRRPDARSITRGENMVIINHEEIPATWRMGLEVADPALLKDLKEGDLVRFTLQTATGQITAIERAKSKYVGARPSAQPLQAMESMSGGGLRRVGRALPELMGKAGLQVPLPFRLLSPRVFTWLNPSNGSEGPLIPLANGGCLSDGDGPQVVVSA